LAGRFRGYGLVLVAAAVWATMGVFYKTLMSAYSLPPLTIVFFRTSIAAVALFIFLGVWRRKALRIERRDWLLFLGFGAIGVAAFYAIYIYAITLAGVGVAAVLMYTAPVWVTGFSVLVLHEPLTGRKGGALLLALAGCALVGRLYALGELRFNWAGLLAGLAAGVTYGGYILFNKAVAQRGYSAWVAIAYGLGLGALFILPWQTWSQVSYVFKTPSLLFWLTVLGLAATLGGGVAFNAALRTVPASNASIVATVEPVIAAFLGWALLHEKMEGFQVLGAGLIVASVVWLQLPQPGRE
jgi:DME family drug/metabolite transporter